MVVLLTILLEASKLLYRDPAEYRVAPVERPESSRLEVAREVVAAIVISRLVAPTWHHRAHELEPAKVQARFWIRGALSGQSRLFAVDIASARAFERDGALHLWSGKVGGYPSKQWRVYPRCLVELRKLRCRRPGRVTRVIVFKPLVGLAAPKQE